MQEKRLDWTIFYKLEDGNYCPIFKGIDGTDENEYWLGGGKNKVQYMFFGKKAEAEAEASIIKATDRFHSHGKKSRIVVSRFILKITNK